jgi:glycosyltransferase involved in cell wall biosynthesis
VPTFNTPSRRLPERRIIHVITRLIAGGAEENTILTCNHQAACGHKVHLIAGKTVDEKTANTLDPRVDLVVVPSLVRPVSPIHDLAALWRLAAIFRKLKPDVIHTHTSKAGIVGRLAALAAPGCSVVHTVHILPFLNVSRLEAFVYIAVERLTARWTALFIDVSDGMKRACLEHAVGRESNHVVIESGMDLARFRTSAPPDHWQSVLAPDCGSETDRPLFVLISGALERRKRVGEFLAVFARVAEAVPEARLLIAGDGPLRPEVEETIAARGLQARVHCLGHIDNLPDIMALSDVCVHAAHREGLPRVVVQYAMVGRPVVAAELPGLERVVQDGVTGFLVPSDDLSAMAEPLIDLLRDADKRRRFADAARAQDFGPWDAARMVASIDEAYDRYLPS